MMWISENICSTVRAWNTLCDAIEERMDVYGVNKENKEGIPRVSVVAPKEWSSLRFPFSDMIHYLSCLLQISYPPLYFNKWVDFDYSGEAARDKIAVDSELLREAGIDAYALHRVPPDGVPFPKHSVTQFIYNAAKIVNDLCIYPAPIRFMIEADLYLEAFDPPYSEKGKASVDGHLSYQPEGPVASLFASPARLVSFQSNMYDLKKVGRTRSTNHQYIYLPQTRSVNRDGWNYTIPTLKGTGGLRSLDAYVSYTDPELGKHDEIKKKIDIDFTIDFNENKATEKIDFSAVQSIVDRYWNLTDDEIEKSIYRADLSGFNTEIYLSADNFFDPKTVYKYYC